jgi:BioD-like phosphotransacetylase family protein
MSMSDSDRQHLSQRHHSDPGRGQGVPIIIVRDDTFTMSKKMDAILSRLKLRDMVKIQQGAQIVSNNVDIPYIKEKLGL